MSRKPVQRTATRRGAAPKKRKTQPRRPRRPGVLDQAVAALPFTEKQLQKIATWGMVWLAGAIALSVAALLGVPGTVGTAAANLLGDAGMRVDEIQIDGLERMDRTTVFAQVLGEMRRISNGAAIQARCLECGALGPAQPTAGDVGLMHAILAKLGA